MKNLIRLEFTVKSLRFLYSNLNTPRLRIVRGKNGFVQIGRFAIIWGVS